MKRKIVFVLLLLSRTFCFGQTVTSFEGIDASQLLNPELDVDPNGSIGTKQYLEWVNVAYQAYDKVTLTPIWSNGPQKGTTPFREAGLTNCYHVGGDGIATFDRMASRWVLAMRATASPGVYYYCVAISNTDDLKSSNLAWYTYQFALNPVLGVNQEGNAYWPDWPKFGVWRDAYYVSFDLNDVNNGYEEIGVVVCALDRTNMLVGNTPKPMQCFSDPSPIPTQGKLFLKHSLIPADVGNSTPPPSGRVEYLLSIQGPHHDGKSTTSNSLNLWAFHVDWVNPANSSFTRVSTPVPTYTPGCYHVFHTFNTVCVPEPSSTTSHNYLDSVGDRLMPRLDYTNFGSYESFLISHTIQTSVNKNQQTGIRWYEFRGSGVPSLYQSGNVSFGQYQFRFMPSIAQDKDANAAAGYSISSGKVHPSMNASWWNLRSNSNPTEISLFPGTGDEENSARWGDYSSMTVDPVDGCTFWYVNQYFAKNQNVPPPIWQTRISYFKLPSCNSPK